LAFVVMCVYVVAEAMWAVAWILSPGEWLHCCLLDVCVLLQDVHRSHAWAMAWDPSQAVGSC
jgi:hypothetical protein